MDTSIVSPAEAGRSTEGYGLTSRQELTQLLLVEKSYFLRVAGSIVRNAADAEDAVHTAFYSAWKVIDLFRGESSLKTWFTRIVQNAAINMLRKRSYRMLSLEDDPEYLQAFERSSAETVDDPERLVLLREQRLLLREYLGELPEETRTVFTLHLAGDYTIDTIAKMRKKSRPSIVSHLQRGKAALRKRAQGGSLRGGVRRPALVY